MKRKMNYLCLFSLLSLIGIIGYITHNNQLYVFFLFLYFIRYYWFIPDELFQLYLFHSAAIAFLTEMVLLIPATILTTCSYDNSQVLSRAFILSFAIAIFVFILLLSYQEVREHLGIHNDQ
ncbi:DUF3796 domain-containing protein [Candidatus Stoquefichus massiliensis]|uniref:DUF3796 domain-containing protein n=1 Tax=Candidatus Stoquefichus massiliensis TaxID=1470350 RepID=UPI000489DB73|nr:DUF3796 domain-containing protein [Candidatus Stoquefichus massiliensis]